VHGAAPGNLTGRCPGSSAVAALPLAGGNETHMK
jgi:hypothetical protein